MKFALTALIALACLALSAPLEAAGMAAQHAATPHGLAFYLSIGAVGAVLGSGALTLSDWAKRLDPDGKVPTIVELLAQSNEMLADMLFREGNLPTGHRTTVRTGLPAVAWRLLNQGVTPSKSSTAQIDEQAGMLEAWSEVDKDLATLNGNISAFRLSEARAFIEAMNQEMQSTVLYGNASLAPEEFTGLSARYSSTAAGNGSNVILAGGAQSDNTSIWLVAWGEETIMGIFPKGSKAGLIHEDFGEQTVEITNGIGGTRMRALQERFQWKAGIALKDWRYVVRIANVDISTIGGTSTMIVDAMEHALSLLPNGLGRPVFYMNRTVQRGLRKEAREAVSAGGGITFDNFDGKRIMMFGDVPIRRVDALLNTETLVS